MKYLVKILRASKIFYEEALQFPNTENCSMTKLENEQFLFASNNLEQFCVFCQSDFFNKNVFEIETTKSNFQRFAVSSVWKNGIELLMFSSIIEALDYDHSKGIHQRMVQEANAEKFKVEFFNLSMCSSVSIHHLSELKELKL